MENPSNCVIVTIHRKKSTNLLGFISNPIIPNKLTDKFPGNSRYSFHTDNYWYLMGKIPVSYRGVIGKLSGNGMGIFIEKLLGCQSFSQ